MPATGAFKGTPASISASELPHTVAIDEEPFELGDLRDETNGVGELFLCRHHGAHGAPSEFAVTDLAAAGRAHAACLAHRVGREVVVQHETLFTGAFERVDELLVLAGTERGDDDRLCLTARKQRRAVGARQDVHLGNDGTNGLQVASVDAAAGLDDVAPHNLALQSFERVCEQHLLGGIIGDLDARLHLGLGLFDEVVALLFLLGGEGSTQPGFGDLLHLRGIFLRVGKLDVPRLLGGLLGELDDRLDDRLEVLMAEHHGL